MASLDSLPPDQRAVLQMVLGRGRSYDQIAKMLSIDRQGVRARAVAALGSLGPSTGVEADRRSEIADYLLGQLPAGEVESVRDRLAETPSERAWARVVASELQPLAAEPLPEIPLAVDAREAEPEPAAEFEPEPDAAVAPEPAEPGPVSAGVQGASSERQPEPVGEPEPVAAAPGEPPPAPVAPEPVGEQPSPRRVSRLGGAVLLGVGAVIVAAVVVIIVLSGGSSSTHHQGAAKGATSPASQSAASSSTAATSTTATPVAQINLLSPSGSKSTAGIAEVLKQGSTTAVAIVGQGLTPNSKRDAYAVWLYNSPVDAVRLGFVNPGVGKNGRLETTGPLPSNASRYKEILISLETTTNPHSPGHIVLQGALTGV